MAPSFMHRYACIFLGIRLNIGENFQGEPLIPDQVKIHGEGHKERLGWGSICFLIEQVSAE